MRFGYAEVMHHEGQLGLVLGLVSSLESMESLQITVIFFTRVSYNCNQILAQYVSTLT